MVSCSRSVTECVYTSYCCCCLIQEEDISSVLKSEHVVVWFCVHNLYQ